MSTPICSRCQKIYSAGSAPAKCINCGGEVKALETKVSTPVNPVSSGLSKAGSSARACSESGCGSPVTMAVKYYYDGKKIIMAPSPNEKVGELIELCTKHAQEYKAPNTWTLIHGESFPSSPELTRQNLANNQQSSGDSGIGTFFMIIFVIAFWAAVIIGGGYLLIEILGWLFSGSGSGGDGTTQPFRLPFRRRR